MSARETRERFWGPPRGRARERRRRAVAAAALLTVPAVLAFAGYGILGAHAAGSAVGTALASLLRPGIPATLALFIPWALVQQSLFQFYLLGRLEVLLGAPRDVPAGGRLRAGLPPVANGLVYGAVHLPDWELALLTAPAGVLWSLSYRHHRQLWPIALSHAVLGTTYFAWVRGQDVLLP